MNAEKYICISEKYEVRTKYSKDEAPTSDKMLKYKSKNGLTCDDVNIVNTEDIDK